MLNTVKRLKYTSLIIRLLIFGSVVLLNQDMLANKVSAQKAETQKLSNLNRDKTNEIWAASLDSNIFGNGFGYKAAKNKSGGVQSNFDFDEDGKTDISIFRPGTGEWWILKSSNGGNQTFQFGSGADKLAPGKYSGIGTPRNLMLPNGATQPGVWNPPQRMWCGFVRNPTPPPPLIIVCFPIGNQGNDVPVKGDFDGDGSDDVAVFCAQYRLWFIRRSSDGQQITKQFGLTTDKPVPEDYDGDGKADIAIFRPSDGQWWIERSTAGIQVIQFGVSTDRPVPADYTGDGKADVAVFRPSTGQWFVLRSDNNSFYSFQFGSSTDTPVPGDYDGDGKNDAAVYRPSNNVWYINRSTAGLQITQFGTGNDVPVPSVYIP